MRADRGAFFDGTLRPRDWRRGGAQAPHLATTWGINPVRQVARAVFVHVWIHMDTYGSRVMGHGPRGSQVCGSWVLSCDAAIGYSRKCLGHHRKGTPGIGNVDCVFDVM